MEWPSRTLSYMPSPLPDEFYIMEQTQCFSKMLFPQMFFRKNAMLVNTHDWVTLISIWLWTKLFFNVLDFTRYLYSRVRTETTENKQIETWQILWNFGFWQTHNSIKWTVLNIAHGRTCTVHWGQKLRQVISHTHVLSANRTSCEHVSLALYYASEVMWRLTTLFTVRW